MLKSELEQVILEINQKLNGGIEIFIKDHRKGDAVINGFISGVAFMMGSLLIQEIKNNHTRRQNRKWYRTHKES